MRQAGGEETTGLLPLGYGAQVLIISRQGTGAPWWGRAGGVALWSGRQVWGRQMWSQRNPRDAVKKSFASAPSWSVTSVPKSSASAPSWSVTSVPVSDSPTCRPCQGFPVGFAVCPRSVYNLGQTDSSSRVTYQCTSRRAWTNQQSSRPFVALSQLRTATRSDLSWQTKSRAKPTAPHFPLVPSPSEADGVEG
jgi:hypothetical protein